MIKKVVIIILIILIFLSSIFYKKANKYKLPKQYKIEIEKLINDETPKTKKEINNIFSEAEKKYLKVINNPQNMNSYMDFVINNYDSYIFSPEFYLYLDLINITKKYTILKDNDIPATDSAGVLYEFLSPYFRDNNVNTEKLDQLSELSESKFRIIEKYYDNAHKVEYPNDNY